MKVSNLRSSKDLNQFAQSIKHNYPEDINHEVQNILDEMGPYDYGDIPNEYANRVMKKIVVLENGAKYEGQWNEQTGERDGMGVQIWPDGKIYVRIIQYRICL